MRLLSCSHHAPFTLAIVVLLLACTAKVDTSSEDSAGSIKIAFGGDSARDPVLRKGDVRIVSTDGVLVLSLIGDTVRMHLSDSLRNSVGAEITKEVDSSGDKSGLGDMIAKSVSKVVTGAMGFVVRVPATDVQNLRFENGHIRFEIRNNSSKVNMNSKSSQNAVFTEADARRFIDAVKTKAERAVAM